MNIVDQDAWLEARLELLEKEKALAKLRDEVSLARQAMPWKLVKQDYRLSNESGEACLAELFGTHSQLVVYHYMFGPGWEEGCKSCSFWADQYDGMTAHLAARNVALAVVSRASWQEFQAFKKRMGWRFPWLSSSACTFNQDFFVSFPDQETGTYNFKTTNVMDEMPGLSVFVKDDSGNVYHSYSTYARGLDPLNSTYQLLDLVPEGRNEAGLPYPMSWIQLHDQYEEVK